jgi:hypothetical protein
MGNLLTYKESLAWENTQTDYSKLIEDLQIAIVNARRWDDLYRTPDLFALTLDWGSFFEVIWETQYDAARRTELFPWMGQIHHDVLVQLGWLGTTPNSSMNLVDLNAEFPNQNNGQISLRVAYPPTPYVYNRTSWIEFHRRYVSANGIRLRREEPDYFREFYIPELTTSANQIQEMIDKEQVPNIFKRVDSPKYIGNSIALHGEQTHMTFNDDDVSALNIDGTWKHGGFAIPADARNLLEEWGFIVP